MQKPRINKRAKKKLQSTSISSFFKLQPANLKPNSTRSHKKTTSQRKPRLLRSTAPIYQLMDEIRETFVDQVREVGPIEYVCNCGKRFSTSSYKKNNFVHHLKHSKRHKLIAQNPWTLSSSSDITTTAKQCAEKSCVSSVTLNPLVVCDGFWHRQIDGVDITGRYNVQCGSFYGIPQYRCHRESEFRGTYKSVLCLKVATCAWSATTPNGTQMCNQCALLPWNKQFIRKVIQQDDTGGLPKGLPPHNTPNCALTPNQRLLKLQFQAKRLRTLKQRIKYHRKSRGVDVAKIACVRKDIRKFIMEINYIARKGSLEKRKVMWSYIQDVIRSEYLRTKTGSEKYSKGMRWSQDTKDLFASQKLMGGKRMNRSQRQNVGGPSQKTVCTHKPHKYHIHRCINTLNTHTHLYLSCRCTVIFTA